MYSINARTWNLVAQAAPLRTEFARRIFPLDQEQMNNALNQEEDSLRAQGVPSEVALALVQVGPLLWENPAIMVFVANNPNFLGTLPDLATVSEAVSRATQEFSLTTSEQKVLARLLRKPPT